MNRFRFVVALLLGIWVFGSGAFAEPAEEEREGGILGTGILGTITKLGSIFVNGQHILFDADLPLFGGISVTQASELQPGHTVAVIAFPEGDQWRAAQIRQVMPLVGPIQVSATGQLSVMGTEVLMESASLTPAAGDWVAISGLWQAGRVVASRIDPVNADAGARIEGSALDFDGGALRIGDTEIRGLIPQHVRDGDVIRATGTPEASGLQAITLETGVFDGGAGVILVEGYLSPPKPSGFYTVLGSNMISFTDNPAMIDPNVRFIACGQGGELSAMVDTADAAADYPGFVSDCRDLSGG